MKAILQIKKDGNALFEGVIEVGDAAGFGKAWEDVWTVLHQNSLDAATSIGALYDRLNEGVLDQIDGAQINLRRLYTASIRST